METPFYRLGTYERAGDGQKILMSELTARKLERPTNQYPESTLKTVLIGVVVVAALYLGREVLVPIALAVLLTFVLAPLVRLLQRWYFPRIIAVALVGLVAFAAIFGLGALMVSQVNQLAADLPRYQSTLGDKVQSLRGVVGGTGTLERASEVLHDLSKQIEGSNTKASPGSLYENGSSDRPIPVEIKQPNPGALQTLAALITPLIHPLTTTGIVAIFVIFILLQRQDLRDRLVRLAGARDLQRTTAALDDAGQTAKPTFSDAACT
jgi:predicted PurR-regulated permease PerM